MNSSTPKSTPQPASNKIVKKKYRRHSFSARTYVSGERRAAAGTVGMNYPVIAVPSQGSIIRLDLARLRHSRLP